MVLMMVKFDIDLSLPVVCVCWEVGFGGSLPPSFLLILAVYAKRLEGWWGEVGL